MLRILVRNKFVKYLILKIDFDRGENGPSKVWVISNLPTPDRPSDQKLNSPAYGGGGDAARPYSRPCPLGGGGE